VKGRKVQFYAEYTIDGETVYSLVLTDGKDGLQFDTNFNPNRYALPGFSRLRILSVATGLLLTEKKYLEAEEGRGKSRCTSVECARSTENS
jgi:hypothetical protein